jgi:hypothetical protein
LHLLIYVGKEPSLNHKNENATENNSVNINTLKNSILIEGDQSSENNGIIKQEMLKTVTDNNNKVSFQLNMDEIANFLKSGRASNYNYQ